MTVLSEDLCFFHHFLNVLINGKDAVEDLSGSLSVETGFTLNGICILLGLLFGFLQSPLNPR